MGYFRKSCGLFSNLFAILFDFSVSDEDREERRDKGVGRSHADAVIEKKGLAYAFLLINEKYVELEMIKLA